MRVAWRAFEAVEWWRPGLEGAWARE